MPYTQRLPTSSTRRLVQENNRSERELEKELNRLEKERAATLRELNNETKIFRLNSGSPNRNVEHTSPSASPRLSNSLRRNSGDAAATRTFHRSRSSSPRAVNTSSDSSPTSSPEAQRRLLIKRPKRSSITEGFPTSVTNSIIISHNDLSHTARRASVTEYFEASEPLSRRKSVNMSQIPQIVISTEDGVVGSFQRRLDSPDRHPGTGELNTDPALPDVDERKESLSLPIRRGRSSSVPSLPPSVTSMNKTLSDMSPPATSRPRSSSISVPIIYSHQRDTPRRSSQQTKQTDRRSSPRRVSFGKLIDDLTRGIEHFELNERDSRRALLSSEEWEKLKRCRYLRMPNEDNMNNKEM